MRQKKFVIVYQTDNNDLYAEEDLTTQEQVDAWFSGLPDDPDFVVTGEQVSGFNRFALRDWEAILARPTLTVEVDIGAGTTTLHRAA